MAALWRESPASVGVVLEQVNAKQDSPLAYTTIMTVLSRLHDKGWVTRQRQGRGYAYTAAYTEAELVELLSRKEVERLVERYGEVALAQFAEALRDVDPDLLEQVARVAGEESDD